MAKDILTGWLENSDSGYFAPKTFDTLVFMKDESASRDSLVDLSTYFQEQVFGREIKIDLSHNNTCALGSMEDESWPGVTGILGTANGGTGNAYGYIRTGASSDTDIGDYSTIEGYGNTGSGKYAHVENANNIASGEGAHAQGLFTAAEGMGSHSGGFLSEATGQYAFTHGLSTIASGVLSFAIGNGSQARGENSFAAGNVAIAKGKNSFVIGTYNIVDDNNAYAFIIGNGSSSENSNAFTIDWNGNAFVKTQLSAADISVTNGLSASDIEISNDLVVGNNTTIGGAATIAKRLTVLSEGASITGPTSITGTLSVSETLNAISDVDVGGDLRVTGITEITGLLTAIAGINAQAASTFDDTVTIAKDLTAQASVTIAQSLIVGGDATINGAIFNAIWDGQIIDVAHGGTGRDTLTSNALLLGNGSEDVAFINPVAANAFLVSNGTDAAPSYKSLTLKQGTYDSDSVGVVLMLDDSVLTTYTLPVASDTIAGIIIAGDQTFSGVKTFSNDTIFQSDIAIAGNVLPDADGYMVGTTNNPWSDIIAWNVSTDTITSAFGGLTISNGNSQIEIIQNDKINLTGSQVHLDCGAVTLSNSNYGYQLPDTGVEGQVFFLLLEE